MYIKDFIDENIVKKIVGSNNNTILLLTEMSKQVNIPELSVYKKTQLVKEAKKLVVKYWDYDICKDILRKLFEKSDKYNSGKNGEQAIQILIEEWENLGLGKISWPFSQGQFDAFVQTLNSSKIIRTEKDEKVKDAALKYRRLKEINTVRNDYLETLIFDKNPDIMPTFTNSLNVDFFINGYSFDQKVSRSCTKQFVEDYGENWKEIASQNPSKVAEYLYRLQDEGRFDADPRLYIVYLDEDISILDLKHKIQEIDFSTPLEITFDYNSGKGTNKKIITYKTRCFVIMLAK